MEYNFRHLPIGVFCLITRLLQRSSSNPSFTEKQITSISRRKKTWNRFSYRKICSFKSSAKSKQLIILENATIPYCNTFFRWEWNFSYFVRFDWFAMRIHRRIELSRECITSVYDKLSMIKVRETASLSDDIKFESNWSEGWKIYLG